MTYASLQNKTIVITGASSGAGKAAAKEFAIHRTNLVLAGRNKPALQHTADECTQRGAQVLTVVTDVTEPEDVRQLASTAAAWKGNIHAWINNAGVLAAGAFDKTPIDISTKVVATNLLGYMHGAHAILPVFKKQGYGILLNNISIGGFYPVPYGAGYTASKFGLRGFSEALRQELAEWEGIHVCDMFSGFLSTPGMQHAANYTGKVLHPGPVLLKPETLAKQMVLTVIHPKPRVFVGVTSHILKTAHAVFPEGVNKITGNVMRKYFYKAPETTHSNGNVQETLNSNMQVHGQYSLPQQGSALKLLKSAGSMVTGLIVGYFAARYFKTTR